MKKFKGAIKNMTRYIVELENNHHYILIDTLTGETFYTPAQDDANKLASILNNYDNNYQSLDKKELMVCENCGFLYFDMIENEYTCIHRKNTPITNLNDTCENWER